MSSSKISIPGFGTTWMAQNSQNKKVKQNNNNKKTKNLFLLIKTYYQKRNDPTTTQTLKSWKNWGVSIRCSLNHRFWFIMHMYTLHTNLWCIQLRHKEKMPHNNKVMFCVCVCESVCVSVCECGCLSSIKVMNSKN